VYNELKTFTLSKENIMIPHYKNLIEILQEYEPGEIWTKRQYSSGEYRWNSPAFVVPVNYFENGNYAEIPDQFSFVSSSDHDREDSLQVSSVWDDKLDAINYLNANC
jgi:hypothetical protein